ncbi:MAG: permease [Candidatus Bathyarchaeota archaeon]|nr:permease [Candidatus Bathyarchaeota archaeon]
MTADLIYLVIENLLKLSPILVVAIVVAQIIDSYLSEETVKKIIKEKSIIKVAAVGLATPGPLVAYLPFLKVLKRRGLPLSIIVAFVTAQTLVGPMRSFIEVEYFGAAFFVYRVIFSFLTAVGIGTCYRFLEKHTS